MDGIVTILEESLYQTVKEIWRKLESECGLIGMRAFPVPHFSWHVATAYDEARLHKVLVQICEQAKPFTVNTSGLGIFTKPKPVLFVALVKDRALMEFHEKLWTQLETAAIQSSPFYSPQSWVPHITLAYEDLSEEAAGCVFNQLLQQPFDWKVRIDNLALIGQSQLMADDAAQSEVWFKHHFGNAK